MREQNRLDHILNILNNYRKAVSAQKGYLPLHIFLQTYYREHKQMGSRDRRMASSTLFNYFRLGSALAGLEAKERIAVAAFLCETEENPFVDFLISTFLPEFNGQLNLSVNQKIELVKNRFPEFLLSDVFPFNAELSAEVDRDAFFMSFLTRPRMFLRLKKGFEKQVLQELEQKNIAYEYPLSLKNALALEATIGIDEMESKKNGYFEIQDLSSQQTGKYFQPKPGQKWWDCCAGSGGKSLMLMDQEPGVDLTVTDIRSQIIKNLKLRFRNAGIRNYNIAVADLSQENYISKPTFDAIIADVPCSGSGTWGRTPEMLNFFNAAEINEYQAKQRTIVASALEALKPGGHLIYITCSVFSKENEDQVSFFKDSLGLEVEFQGLMKGYNDRADTLFVARMRKVK
jgi:16S rRNA (cytosine967-C5)-methyltransferase